MEINHHISFNTSRNLDFLHTLGELEIEFKSTKIGKEGMLISFDIVESDTRWETIKSHVSTMADIVNTIFSTEEILSSEWLRLVPIFETGYPQPETTWVKSRQNYANFCEECGTFSQVKPFKIKREPNLRGRHFMSLYWTYALFGTPPLIFTMSAQGITSFESWDVIIQKADYPSQRIRQIHIPKFATKGFVNETNLRFKICTSCETTKYLPHMRGIMYFEPSVFEGIHADIFQTYEWFGDGHSAYREIIVSNKFARLIIKNKWKGVQLKVAGTI